MNFVFIHNRLFFAKVFKYRFKIYSITIFLYLLKDRKDGSCGVSYRVTEPGEYLCSIRFNDDHIPNSPFRVIINEAMERTFYTPETKSLNITSIQDRGLSVSNSEKQFFHAISSFK